MKKYYSIVQDNFEDRVCMECGRNDIEIHHIFEGRQGNKDRSKDYGLMCCLCRKHHRDNWEGVHGCNTELDTDIKTLAEIRWLEHNPDKKIKNFIEEFGQNYLEV